MTTINKTLINENKRNKAMAQKKSDFTKIPILVMSNETPNFFMKYNRNYPSILTAFLAKHIQEEHSLASLRSELFM